MAWRKVWDAGKARHTSPTPGAALLRRGLPESSQLASVTYRARPPHVVTGGLIGADDFDTFRR